jgi:ATP-dependent protease ClpP protease subunit/predicted  nucleic acid-binding Zn-ribbon protein
MLINKLIGVQKNGNGEIDYSKEWVDGARFQEELMQLDEMGKKRIIIYICSEGGSVFDAMRICSAILQTKTPVDTVNTGICASAASFVWACGRKRAMYDYALNMFHPVQGADNSGREAITNSISTILASNSTLSEEQFKYMMGCTTWASASECFENGLCTDIIKTKESNKKYMQPSNSLEEMLAYSNKLTDEIINNLKTPEMDLKQITNKLGLQEGVDLTTIVNHIDSIVSAKNHAEQELSNLQSKLDEAQKEKEAAESKITELQNEINTAKQAAELVEATNKATELVNQFKERIGNKVESIELWKNKAIQDLEGTKNLLESLPFNKLGRQIEHKEEVTAPLNVQNMMMEIQNRTKNK